MVERQRRLIAERRARGFDTEASEQLLQQFERSQAILEDDLARLQREAEAGRATAR